MFQVKQFAFNHFQTNCYIVWDEASKQCAIVDPACETSSEEHLLDRFILSQQLTPTLLLLTHAHTDHICGLRYVATKYQLAVTTHRDSIALLRTAGGYGSVLGFDVDRMDDLDTHLVEDGDKLQLGNGEIECRYVPGHCPGSMAYVLHAEQMVITGDALFRMSIGRTDLPGGDLSLLLDKIHQRLLTLDGDFMVLPGHGDCSSIAEEVNMNPFL